MIIFIFVKNFEIFKYRRNEYIIISIYFSNKNKNENVVIIKIMREIHLVDDLKINIFGDNNFIN